MMEWKILYTFFAISLYICEGFKILVVFPMPGKSHKILGDGYVRHLLNAGHEVTYVTPFPYKSTHERLKLVDVSNNIPIIPENLFNIEFIMYESVNFNEKNVVFGVFTELARNTLADKNVQDMLNDDKVQFDLVIAEWLFSELYAGDQISAVMMEWKILYTFFAISLYICEGFKILVVFPMPGKSHKILGDGYVRHLLNAGHEVTYVTPFPYKSTHERLKLVDVSNNIPIIPENLFNIEFIMYESVNFNEKNVVFGVFTELARNTLADKNVQDMLNDDKVQFDLVIAEWLFSELYAGFSAVFECPYIWSSSVYPHWLIMALIEGTKTPEYFPDMHSRNVAPLSFTQRVTEFVEQMSGIAKKYLRYHPMELENYNKFFVPILVKKGKKIPAFDELMYNASLVMANTDISLSKAQALPQNCVPIGGYHVEPVLPLPKELKSIMDKAQSGVIYFSMGSNLNSTSFPRELKRKIIEMLGELNNTVVWKFEEVLPDLPKNVHVLPWAPQQSILAHPNCVLFITHGGYLSVTEAVHFGVPIVGIPVFADQFTNVEKAARRGFGRKVNLNFDFVDSLKAAVEEVVGNQSYRQITKRLSAVYFDRPASPDKQLVDWVEYVIRTKGAPHLRCPALLMPWYQQHYLDLLVLVLVIVFAIKITVFCLATMLLY